MSQQLESNDKRLQVKEQTRNAFFITLYQKLDYYPCAQC